MTMEVESLVDASAANGVKRPQGRRGSLPGMASAGAAALRMTGGGAGMVCPVADTLRT